MLNRKLIGGVALIVLTVGFILQFASTGFTVSDTSGLVSLNLQGVGVGSLATGDCVGIACKTGDTCACLGATYSLAGNQGFKGGGFTVALSVDITGTGLPISDLPDTVTPPATGSCSPATGFGTISSPGPKVKNTVKISISGLECPSLSTAPDVFSGTYVVTGGTGKYSTSSGGTGAINGSQVPTSGGASQVLIVGSLQPKTQVVTTPTPTPTATPTTTATPTATLPAAKPYRRAVNLTPEPVSTSRSTTLSAVRP